MRRRVITVAMALEVRCPTCRVPETKWCCFTGGDVRGHTMSLLHPSRYEKADRTWLSRQGIAG
jgi:hypothetical protein